jgi:hypothetical protein
MEEVFNTGELQGYIKFFYGEDWEKQAKKWEKENDVIMGTYYRQAVGGCIMVCYYPRKNKEDKNVNMDNQ